MQKRLIDSFILLILQSIPVKFREIMAWKKILVYFPILQLYIPIASPLTSVFRWNGWTKSEKANIGADVRHILIE